MKLHDTVTSQQLVDEAVRCGYSVPITITVEKIQALVGEASRRGLVVGFVCGMAWSVISWTLWRLVA